MKTRIISFTRSFLLILAIAFALSFQSLPADAEAPAPVRSLITENPWTYEGQFSEGGPLRTMRANSFAYGDPTASEQAHLEAINRARMNPFGEAARYGIDLFEGVPTGEISGQPSQPLTHNRWLGNAAQGHSNDMIARDFFAHVNPDGLDPFDRIAAAGYDFQMPGGAAGENIAIRFSTGPLVEITEVLQMHADLFIDEGVDGRGHRVNILDGSFREVGVGVAFGEFQGFANAYALTTDFGTSLTNPNPFLLGVVFDDQNTDGTYTAGEGIGNVVVDVVEAGMQTKTAGAGGYGMPIPPGTYTVKARQPDGRVATRNVTIGARNVKVDFLDSQFASGPGSPVLPDAAVLVNGVPGSVSITTNDPLTLSVGLDSGDSLGMDADWWLVMLDADLNSFDLTPFDFVPGFFVTLQTPLLDFNPVPVFSRTLSVGKYTFCFGIDLVMDGDLDLDKLYYECAVVTVTQP